ncbi:hypothetical protein B0J14DRAFT_560075 [Halenospora varia]|nr:hypothetical protein B0J14DRAFT_560075 [Halenospora varia]
MSRFSLKKLLFGFKKTKFTDTSQPPPCQPCTYQAAVTQGKQNQEPKRPPEPSPSIKVTDVPQWEWSTAQCREWFHEFLTQKLSYTPEDAIITAARLEGWGPSIYTRTMRD